MSYNKTVEQYKIYLDTIEKVTDRRIKSNAFFITILSALISLIAVILSSDSLSVHRGLTLLVICLFSMGLCLIWVRTIESYKKLNGAKFKIILEMEKELKHRCLSCEWDLLKENSSYKILSKNEKQVPHFFIAFIVFIFIGYLCA